MDAARLKGVTQDIGPMIDLGKATRLTPVAQPESASPGFGVLLRQALDAVNQRQQDANAFRTRIETGESNDLMGAMLAGQKAGLAFQALVQVRNKAVAAYEEIMRMQV